MGAADETPSDLTQKQFALVDLVRLWGLAGFIYNGITYGQW